jgi:hypothetical protein
MVWACAQIGWFYANENLSMQIAFPIITTAPGIIGTLWGILLHDEISLKTSNLLFLGTFHRCSVVASCLSLVWSYVMFEV